MALFFTWATVSSVIQRILSLSRYRPISFFLFPCCGTCQRGRGHWCHLEQCGGTGQRGGGWFASLLEGCRLLRCNYSPLIANKPHSRAGWRCSLTEVSLVCAAARARRFPTNNPDFCGFSVGKRKSSFRGRIQSSKMRNMILMALLLVRLPTGEALKVSPANALSSSYMSL